MTQQPDDFSDRLAAATAIRKNRPGIFARHPWRSVDSGQARSKAIDKICAAMVGQKDMDGLFTMLEHGYMSIEHIPPHGDAGRTFALAVQVGWPREHLPLLLRLGFGPSRETMLHMIDDGDTELGAMCFKYCSAFPYIFESVRLGTRPDTGSHRDAYVPDPAALIQWIEIGMPIRWIYNIAPTTSSCILRDPSNIEVLRVILSKGLNLGFSDQGFKDLVLWNVCREGNKKDLEARMDIIRLLIAEGANPDATPGDISRHNPGRKNNTARKCLQYKNIDFE
jgi:hypothetical protein